MHKNQINFKRDRLGVRPLFYYHKNGIFLYGTDIKTILAHPSVKPQVDKQGIAELILLGPGRTPSHAIFKDIKSLPPATRGYYDSDTNKLTLRKYWELTDKPHTDSFEETKQKVRALLIESIERSLESENIIGTFLSGGLDSSIISAVANRYLASKGKKLETFSVDYKDNDKHFRASKFQPNSDIAYIEEMNSFLGAKHHRILLDTDELVDALYDAVDARGLPGMADIDASLLLFCRKVKPYIDVALSGEGADEIFGGYPWFRDETIRNIDGFPWAGSLEFRKSFLKDDFANAIDSNYVQERYRSAITSTHILQSATPLERRMKEMTNLNLKWFGQTLFERKHCMSTMAGLATRLPFCDYRLVEYLYAVPWEYKDYKGREKGLLREAMTGILPDNVLWRKKSPYPKTHNPAYLTAVSNRLREVISDSSAPILKIIKKEALENLLGSQESTPWYGQLMTTPQTIAYFLQINYWLDKYKVEIVD
ncbi:MAG: asparagine synthase (glutamine-hydrolyzing) [Firmicutes bacterium]|nr:asparagine synthase (glutamine-hydrolyzing) [Bacillota bacterium]